MAGERDYQHAQSSQLGRECLGRGDADLRAGARQHHQVRFPYQRAFRHVADRQRRQVAELLAQSHRGQRIGRLPGLRNRYQQGVLLDHGIAVAVFAGDLDPTRQPAVLFDEVTGDDAGMKAGAAGDDMHAGGAPEDLRRRRSKCGFEQVPVGHALLQGVGNGARLLVDFLEHVVLVRALFGGVGREFALAHRPRHVAALAVKDAATFARDFGHVAFLQKHETPRDRQERGNVGSDEILVLAQADDDRATHAGDDDAVWLLLADHGERVGPFEFDDRGAHRLEQIAKALHVKMDSVRDDFGIGLGFKLIARGFQLLAQLLVILDDAVVHDGEAVARDVRVRVALAGGSVRCPAGVGDAQRARDRRAPPIHLRELAPCRPCAGGPSGRWRRLRRCRPSRSRGIRGASGPRSAAARHRARQSPRLFRTCA